MKPILLQQEKYVLLLLYPLFIFYPINNIHVTCPTIIVSYLIFRFVCLLIPFIAMPLLLNTKIKSAKKDSSNPSPGSTGQLGNSTFGVQESTFCLACHDNRFKFVPQYKKIEPRHGPSVYSDTVVEQKFWASKVTAFSISWCLDSITPTVENIMSDENGKPIDGFSVVAARYGTKPVAQSFNSKTKNQPYGLNHYDSHGADAPGKLNFHVTVDLSYFIRYEWGAVNGTIKDVTFGQGTSNDWWIISPNCDWHQPPRGKPTFRCLAHSPQFPVPNTIFFVPARGTFVFGYKNNQVMVCREGVNCDFPPPGDVPPHTATCGDLPCNPKTLEPLGPYTVFMVVLKKEPVGSSVGLLDENFRQISRWIFGEGGDTCVEIGQDVIPQADEASGQVDLVRFYTEQSKGVFYPGSINCETAGKTNISKCQLSQSTSFPRNACVILNYF